MSTLRCRPVAMPSDPASIEAAQSPELEQTTNDVHIDHSIRVRDAIEHLDKEDQAFNSGWNDASSMSSSTGDCTLGLPEVSACPPSSPRFSASLPGGAPCATRFCRRLHFSSLSAWRSQQGDPSPRAVVHTPMIGSSWLTPPASPPSSACRPSTIRLFTGSSVRTFSRFSLKQWSPYVAAESEHALSTQAAEARRTSRSVAQKTSQAPLQSVREE